MAMKGRKLPPAPNEMVVLFDQVIQSVPGAQVRKMFGYPAAFLNGNMFAGLYDNYMMLRLSPHDLKTFLEHYKSHLFEPMPGRPMREYGVVPPALLTSESELMEWLGKSFDYVNSLPPKQPKKKKK
jgi:TfoX/Sxy family transcriptional regulator of competence genes